MGLGDRGLEAPVKLGDLQSPTATQSITAFATGGQANATQINTSWNVIQICASGGDSVKLPASFRVNTLIYIKNSGAQSCDVFPGSGDDLGQGANTAEALPANESVAYIATVADTTWEVSIVHPVVAEVNDLTVAVTWANVPDVNITQGSVTQHEAALTILESQITDGSLLARVGSAETISAIWDFTTNPQIDAAGIDTGTFADARIAASNVTQHVGALEHSSLLNVPATISQAEAEAGTATTDRLFTAQRVSQAIAALGGAGDVTKVGTPVNNQIGVWTGDGTLEGDANFVWDGSNILLGGNIIFNATGSPRISNLNATDLIPNILPDKSDPNTGFGYTTLDTGAIIAGGLCVAEYEEFINHPKFVIDPNSAGTGGPTLAFATGAVGFKGTATELSFMTGSNTIFRLVGSTFRTNLTGGGGIINQVASATLPSIIVSNGDVDTGFGALTADQLSIIAGGLEMMRFVESTVDQVIIGPAGLIGTAALPSLAWGDGDTGFVETVDDTLKVSLVGVARWVWSADVFGAETGAGPAMLNVSASSTVPTQVPNQADPNTGVGRGGVDRLNLIAGGVTCMSVEETGGSTPQIGFYATAPISLQTGVAVTEAGIHAALVNLGLITA